MWINHMIVKIIIFVSKPASIVRGNVQVANFKSIKFIFVVLKNALKNAYYAKNPVQVLTTTMMILLRW